MVVPIYNAANTIRRCVDSIVNQDSNYRVQCILINDGSTDESGKILLDYSNCAGVTIINQKNKGFSGARNTGLDLIKGTYVMFVDSDDRLSDMAISNLLDVAFKYDADVVAGNYKIMNENGKIIRAVDEYTFQKIDPEGTLHGYPWGKVFKADFFRNLRFPEHYWYEDSIFEQIVWPLAKNTYTISQSVYEYTENPKGISKTSLNKPKSIDSLYITEQLIKDRQYFGLIASPENFASFLRMVKLTYWRTRRCSGIIAKCIFVVQCDLCEYYEGIQIEENKKLQTALKNKDFVKYIKEVS